MSGEKTTLKDDFAQLGLSEYIDRFIAEGFVDWTSISDITESDLAALAVKLGHRRILYREIATKKGFPQSEKLEEYHKLVNNSNNAHSDGQASHAASESGSDAALSPRRRSTSIPRKRRYKRHPKPDDNAPSRPPSAYVIFANMIREEEKDSNYSFTQFARLVGDRWKNLNPVEKEAIESQAANLKRRYTAEVTMYKTSREYHQYQAYLAEFKERVLRDEKPEKLEPPRKAQRSTNQEPSPGGPQSTDRPIEQHHHYQHHHHHPYWAPDTAQRQDHGNNRITITSILQDTPDRLHEPQVLPSVDYVYQYAGHDQFSGHSSKQSSSVRTQSFSNPPDQHGVNPPVFPNHMAKEDGDHERIDNEHQHHHQHQLQQ